MNVLKSQSVRDLERIHISSNIRNSVNTYIWTWLSRVSASYKIVADHPSDLHSS